MMGLERMLRHLQQQGNMRRMQQGVQRANPFSGSRGMGMNRGMMQQQASANMMRPLQQPRPMQPNAQFGQPSMQAQQPMGMNGGQGFGQPQANFGQPMQGAGNVFDRYKKQFGG